jgi:Flp pilus assembly protein TadG
MVYFPWTLARPSLEGTREQGKNNGKYNQYWPKAWKNQMLLKCKGDDMESEKGVSAVEFAIVLPVLVLLLVGTMEFSILLYDQAMITNASREGARAGIVFHPNRLSDAEIKAVVDNYCAGHLITFGAAPGPTTNISRAGSGSVGDPLTVTVNYQYDFLVLPNFMSSLAGGINLAGQTVMRME